VLRLPLLQVQPPGQLPTQAACVALLLAAAAAATVWAIRPMLPAHHQQQQQQQQISTLAPMKLLSSDTPSDLAGSVSYKQQPQPSRDSAQDVLQPLQTIQQLLGVLGGGLLLQVRPQSVLGSLLSAWLSAPQAVCYVNFSKGVACLLVLLIPPTFR
jgi:hypothetical protein